MSVANLKPDDLFNALKKAALNASEKRSFLAVASAVVSAQGVDEPPLYQALYRATTQVRDRKKRHLFVVRVIAALNQNSTAQFGFPKRQTVKKTRALASPNIVVGQWGVLIPELIRMCPPGLLRLGLLMSNSMGFGKSAVDAYLLNGERELGVDNEFRVPISRADLKHFHIIHLPESLAGEVLRCFKVLSGPPYDKDWDEKALAKRLKFELKELLLQFELDIVKGAKPRLHRKYIKKAPLLPLLGETGITVTRLFEAARTSGVAKDMPGYLRDMLAQRVLPASAARIDRTMGKPVPPISENHGRRNKTAADKALDLSKASRSEDYVNFLSRSSHIPEDVWCDWQAASELSIRALVSLESRTSKKYKEILLETITNTPNIFVNSWCAWALQFLITEGKEKKWTPRTFKRYRALLLPPELAAFTSAIDVEEFDEEDLGALIGSIADRGNSKNTDEAHRSLICRMIRYAQELQPDFAFPEITITIKGGELQLNKRAHILHAGEMESLVHREWLKGHTQEAMVLGLIGFTGMRPVEIMRLNKRDITLLPDALEINIRRSKSSAGCRCVPVHALAPLDVHRFLLGEFRSLVQNADDEGRLFKVKVGRAASRRSLIDPAMLRLRDNFGGGIDLYTLRHSFASWSFIRMYMAAYPKCQGLQRFPSLGHALFNSQLGGFASLIYHQRPYHFDPDAMYRLSKLMGHATADTLPRTYIHSCGIVHSAFLG